MKEDNEDTFVTALLKACEGAEVYNVIKSFAKDNNLIRGNVLKGFKDVFLAAKKNTYKTDSIAIIEVIAEGVGSKSHQTRMKAAAFAILLEIKEINQYLEYFLNKKLTELQRCSNEGDGFSCLYEISELACSLVFLEDNKYKINQYELILLFANNKLKSTKEYIS
ncbi:MAG TPA: hypothetical protein VFQ59_03320 [Candidatus Paceibacterota bacterium]|nr:hypothetical protein [Candidatus Paceibacterota bacterium]